MIIYLTILIVCSGLIIYHFVLYPIVLKILILFQNNNEESLKETNELPFISIIITAHNEERVIRRKIENCLEMDYPKEKFEIILANDWSEDNTIKAIEDYISSNKVVHFKPDKHLGKTYAQNGAVKVCKGKIIAFSDANTLWNRDVLRKFAKDLSSREIGFVAGALNYIENDDTRTAKAEGIYWEYELAIRSLESELKSILTSNGAIYAIRRELYIDMNPLYSHDSAMPPYIVSLGKKAIFDNSAIAKEKMIKNARKEFSRKIRMFGRMYSFIFNKDIRKMIKKTGFLYRFMYFSHRTLRFILPVLTVLVLCSLCFVVFTFSVYVGLSTVLAVIMLFLLKKTRFILGHYILTIIAMIVGFYNYSKGKIKPYWKPVDDAR